MCRDPLGSPPRLGSHRREPDAKPPSAYLSLMLERLPNARSAEDFEALLPWHLKSAPRWPPNFPRPWPLQNPPPDRLEMR